MEVVRLDPYGADNAADEKQSFADFVESELDDIETEIQSMMEKWQAMDVPGRGPMTISQFLQFLTTEEFHPQQGYRYLAVQILIYRCEWDLSLRISGVKVRNYAIERGYCNG